MMEELEIHIRHGRLPGRLQECHNMTKVLNYNPMETMFLHNGSDNFSITDNTTVNLTDPTQRDSSVDPKVILCVVSFFIFCCVVSLVVNVVILVSACFMRSRVNNTLYISLSLAAADTFSLFFLALVMFLFSFLPRVGFLVNAPCAMLLIEALRMGAIMTNLFHLAALAFNHYVGILLPLRMITRRNIQYCIVILWTLPSSLLIFDMFYLEAKNDKLDDCDQRFLARTKFRKKFTIPFFTILTLMTFIYSHIYRLVCKHQTHTLDWVHRHRSNHVTKKAIVTTIMILGSTIIGWLPPFTYYALFCEDCFFREEFQKLRDTAKGYAISTTINFLLIIKPATNFYIYAFRMKEIRGALRRMRRRVYTFLWRPKGGGNRYEMRELNLAHVKSRTSTFRSRTCSIRASFHHEQTSVGNGIPSCNTTWRCCQCSSTIRRKRPFTSL